MAMSTQRLIIMVLMLDLIIGLIGGFLYTGQDGLEYTTYTDSYDNWTKDYQDIYPEATPDAETVYLDKQFGDSKYGGKAITNLFGGGVTLPKVDSCNGASCNNENAKILFWIVTAIISLLNILVAYETFLIFYSKKNT